MLNLTYKDKLLITLIIIIAIVGYSLLSFTKFTINQIAFHNSKFAELLDISKENNSDIPNNPNGSWLNVDNDFRISQLKNRVTILYFREIDCFLCGENESLLQDLKQQFGNKINIITIFNNKDKISSLDFRSEVIKYLQHFRQKNITLLDFKSKISELFLVDQFPKIVILNQNGKEVRYNKNKGDGLYAKIKLAIKKTINKSNNLSRETIEIVPESQNNSRNILNFPKQILLIKNFQYQNHSGPAIAISNSLDHNIIIINLGGKILAKIGRNIEGSNDGSFNEARFNSPQGLFFDDNKLYIADTGNNLIRLANFTDATVTTLLGSKEMGSVIEDDVIIFKADDVNLASPTSIIALNDFYYNNKNKQKKAENNEKSNITQKLILGIANSSSNQILAYHIDKHRLEIFAGSGIEGLIDGNLKNSSLAYPSALFSFDKKIYFIDVKTSTLRVITGDGNIKTLINKDENSNNNSNKTRKSYNNCDLNNPQGLFIDDTGIYIANSFNHQICKFDLSGKFIDVIAGNSRYNIRNSNSQNALDINLSQPQSIIAMVDNFYISDSNNNTIFAINRGNLNSKIVNISPEIQIDKKQLLEYLPNIYKTHPIVINNKNSKITIALPTNHIINKEAPSFLNILEISNIDNAILIKNFNGNNIISAYSKISSNKNQINNRISLTLPMLEDDKKYLIHGTIYFCEDIQNNICKIMNYEQEIISRSNSDNSEITFTIKN